MKKLLKILFQLLIANTVIFICIGIASVIPGLSTGTGGRDFLPQAFYAGIFILVVSIQIRFKFKWPNLHMILYLVPSQFFVFIAMSYFSGYTIVQLLSSFDLFSDFLQWLFFFDLFICVPWIMGVFISSFVLKMSNKDKKTGQNNSIQPFVRKPIR